MIVQANFAQKKKKWAWTYRKRKIQHETQRNKSSKVKSISELQEQLKQPHACMSWDVEKVGKRLKKI
jgi:hypothetical protein